MPSYRFSCDECSFEEYLSMSISDYLDLKDNIIKSSMCDNKCTYSKIISFIISYGLILNAELTTKSYVSTKRGGKIYNHIFDKKL